MALETLHLHMFHDTQAATHNLRMTHSSLSSHTFFCCDWVLFNFFYVHPKSVFRQKSCENCSCPTQNVQFLLFCVLFWKGTGASGTYLHQGLCGTVWEVASGQLDICGWDICGYCTFAGEIVVLIGICVFETGVNIRPLVHQWHLVVIWGTVNTPLHYSSLLFCVVLSSCSAAICSANMMFCFLFRSLGSVLLKTWWVMSKLSKQTGDSRREARALRTHRLSHANTARKQSVQLRTWSRSILNLYTGAGTVYFPVCWKGEVNIAHRPNSQKPVYHSAHVWTQIYTTEDGPIYLKVGRFLRGDRYIYIVQYDKHYCQQRDWSHGLK